MLTNKKKRTCQLVGFAIPVDHKVKIKETEKLDKYLDLARELKNVVDFGLVWFGFMAHQPL